MQTPLSEPLVSILTPSFNQARWLADNLASVACQSYASIEHVVLDGGSTDGSVGVLSKAGPRVMWLSEPDKGQADALNKAFARSRGEIIGWLNSDDAYFDCRVVEDVVRFFARHPEVDVVYGHAARVSADGRVIHIVWVPRFSLGLLKWECFLEQPAVFLRRRVIEERFLDDSFQFAMDWELWLRLGLTCTFKRMGRVLAVDRLQPDRKMKTWLPVLEKDRARLVAMYGVGESGAHPLRYRLLYVASRLGGARFVLGMPTDLAFGGQQDDRWALLKRQVLSRQSRWPAEFV
jgi:glycosyltransferase involved in cell wall biosynthesis